MHSTYAQTQKTAQKKEASTAAAVLDASSQNEGLQRKADMANGAAQREEAPRPNNTGMPDNLKSGIESLSGFSMDDVRVHYNSSKPATVQALAYTQGTDIHVAPGQEKHLPHEAWHVAQQMAGRVSPTTNINGMPVNDNAALEHEADVMGEKAVQCKDMKEATSNNILSNMNSIQRFPASPPDNYTASPAWVDKCTITRSRPIYQGKDNSSLGKHDEKVKALQAISAEAGNLGNLTRVGGTCALAGNESFSAVIPAEYKTSKGSSVDLTLTYNFRNGKAPGGDVGGPGYITQVSRKRTKEGVDYTKTAKMVNTPPKGAPLTPLKEGTYYNVHERTPLGLDIPTVLNETSSSGKEFTGLAPDSYTKLAGEGARFMCVRNNMHILQQNSVFWDDDLKCGVAFEDLYRSWAWSFGSKYNISDKDIHDKLEKMKQDYGEYKLKTGRVIHKNGSAKEFFAPAVDASDSRPRINLDLGKSPASPPLPHTDETEDKTGDQNVQPPAKVRHSMQPSDSP
ncbi:MAG: DUF4157 domain-containing protein [Fibrobacter sp.]|nr:DUF4157 domain-containing protein [Fibrobacter sp.]MBO7059514.1 DUF4157 domain-containing protein [Fibrobacter sp.]